MLAILKDYIEVQEKKRKVEKWYCMMQTIVDQKHWAWRNIFPEGDLFLLSASLSIRPSYGARGEEIPFFPFSPETPDTQAIFLQKKFVAARYPNLKLFQNVFANHGRDG